MTNDAPSKHDQVLWLLVHNLMSNAMTQLGKMPGPDGAEPEVHLEAARFSIDLLEMLQDKCRHNTDAEIMAALDQAVMNLQLNYADEAKKAAAQEGADAAPAEEAPAAEPAPEADPPADPA